MCPFLLPKITYWRSFSRLSNVSSHDGNERMEKMSKYNYDAIEAGKRIRAIRRKNKMTQEQLAEQLFLTAESVSNFENGKTMCMPENVAKICEMFGVTADYIYYGVEGSGSATGADNIVNLLKGCNADELDRIEKMIALFLNK